MKQIEFKTVAKLLLLNGLSIIFIVSFIIIMVFPKIKIVEVDNVVVKEIEVNNCACIPCIDAPIPECEFKSFAYKSIVNEYDDWGNRVLTKGDIYTLIKRPWFEEWDAFCNHRDIQNPNPVANKCYRQEDILNKKLFKPVN